MKDSSIINGVQWANGGWLTVTLKNGGVYEYGAVPEQVYRDFIVAVSLGEYYSKFIKGKYDFAKMDDVQDTGIPENHGADVSGAWPFPTYPKPVAYAPVLTAEQSTDLLEWTEGEEEAFLDIVTNQDSGKKDD